MDHLPLCHGGKGRHEIEYLHGNIMFSCFMLLNYMKAYVSMYFLHLMLTFPPKMMYGPLHGSALVTNWSFALQEDGGC